MGDIASINVPYFSGPLHSVAVLKQEHKFVFLNIFNEGLWSQRVICTDELLTIRQGSYWESK